MSRKEAVRTSRFWIVAAASATVGLLSTALNFHQISMLGDAGLTATEAAAMFLPQVIGAAVAGVLFGYLADRLTGRILIPITMGMLAISLAFTLVLAPGTAVILYAISLGASAGGASRTVTSTLLPRWFGVAHIGAIQGTTTLVNVASTALGPVMLAVARDFSGNYSVAAWFVLLPAAVALTAAVMMPAPSKGDGAESR